MRQAILALTVVAACGVVLSCSSAPTSAIVTSVAAPQALSDEGRCAALAGKAFPTTLTSLPTRGGRVESSEFTTAGYCKVLGEIAPVDPAAPPIRFQVNLPKAWNGKALQCGGGGLNGNLVACDSALRDAPPGPTALARGYATFGTDGGHQNSTDKPLQSFALNHEALVNHAYASYKKTFDIAKALVSDYYGRAPSRVYFFGGSEGGREALAAVQKYPQDYDGVISVVPVLSWTGTQLAGYRQYLAASGDGWMGPAKVALVHKATLAACDVNDGLADGMIAKYMGCNSAAKVRALRCPGGRDTGDSCLSDAQIALVETVRTPTPYGFGIANNEANYPGYAIGGEANRGNMIPTIVTPTRPSPEDNGQGNYAVGDVRYFFLRDPAHRGVVDWKKHEARIREVSALMDMNDPDLSRFKARGGKLIMKSNAADYLVAPESVWRYYERVTTTMGQASADEFFRFYVAPWAGHGGSGTGGDGAPAPDKVDLLAALEAWVERGEAPADQLTLTSYNEAKAPIASWPMCRYPNYPHYSGDGAPKDAASYVCKRAK